MRILLLEDVGEEAVALVSTMEELIHDDEVGIR